MRGHQKIAKKSLRVRLWKDYQKRAVQVLKLFRNIFFQKKCQDEPKCSKERNVGAMLDAGVCCGGHPRNPAHWPSRKSALPMGGLLAPSQDSWALQKPPEKRLGSVRHTAAQSGSSCVPVSYEGHICVALPANTRTDPRKWGTCSITEMTFDGNKRQDNLSGLRD